MGAIRLLFELARKPPPAGALANGVASDDPRAALLRELARLAEASEAKAEPGAG